MEFASTTHITCNEAGMEELSYEYERTLAQRVLFRQPTTKTFERWPTGWRHKSSGAYASAVERAEITMALAKLSFDPWSQPGASHD